MSHHINSSLNSRPRLGLNFHKNIKISANAKLPFDFFKSSSCCSSRSSSQNHLESPPTPNFTLRKISSQRRRGISRQIETARQNSLKQIQTLMLLNRKQLKLKAMIKDKLWSDVQLPFIGRKLVPSVY